MVYYRLPNNTPEILRKHGLKVVEVDGWQKRGRPLSTGEFSPVGVLCHHTATGKNWTDKAVVDLLVKGRKDLPGPLVQFGLARDGTVYLIASGRCNHAGKAKASGTVASGDGNKLYLGIEAFNDGVAETYPLVQYNAYVLLCAVLSTEITGNSVQTVRGHKETSQTGKPDPRFDMDKFRNSVNTKMIEIINGPVAPVTPEVPLTSGLKLWMKYSGKPSGELKVTEAMGWTPMDCVIKDAPPFAGHESHMLYARVDFAWTNPTGMAKVECKFVRSNDDETAFDERHYEHGTKSIPFQHMHFEEGSKLTGKWYMKVHGGGAVMTLTTRYCKTHVIGS